MTNDRTCQADGCDRPMPTGDNSTACPACWHRHANRMAAMPDLISELETTLARQTSTGSSGPRGSETPLPYSTAASDALRLLHSTMWPWAREGLDAHPQIKGRTPLRRSITDLGAAVTDMADLLEQLHGWLVTHPEGADAIDEIAYAFRQAGAAIDRAPEKVYAGTCECGEELYGSGDDLTVQCTQCEHIRDISSWRIDRLADAADQLLTLTQITWAVATTTDQTITRKRLEGWVRRGWLLRSGNVGAVPTYRVGDVLDLLTRRAV